MDIVTKIVKSFVGTGWIVAEISQIDTCTSTDPISPVFPTKREARQWLNDRNEWIRLKTSLYVGD